MGEQNPENSNEKDQIRRYLLGNVPDEAERERIEQKLMVDDRYYEELLFQEEELVEEYVNGELVPEESRALEAQILISERLEKKVGFAKGFGAYIAKQVPNEEMEIKSEKSSVFARLIKGLAFPVPAAAAIMVLLLAGIAFWAWYSRQSPAGEALIALNRAYQINRPIESRVTELDYAPFSNTRGASDDKVDLNERNRAELLLLNEVARNRSPETLLGLARIYLAKRSFEEAISQLESAQQLAPNNAEIQNDLGVAFLERSRASIKPGEGENLVLKSKALEKFERAIELDPNLLPAYFNRAACLQSLPLTEQARQAWQEYLRRDPDSPWSEEARRNLGLIESSQSKRPSNDEVLQAFFTAYRGNNDQLAHSIQSGNREMISGKLIPQQLAFLFAESNDGERAAYLSALDYLGRLDRQNSGDPFFAELSNFYSNLPAKRLPEVQGAHSAVKKGYELSLLTNFSAAREEFDRARSIYENLGNVWETMLCDYWIAYCDYQIDKIQDSSIRLIRLADISKEKKYYWLAAQVYYWLSVNSRTKNELSKAFKYVDDALEAALRTGDNYSIQKTYSWRADTRMRVKQFSSAAGDLENALGLGSMVAASPRQSWRDLDVATQLLYGMKLNQASAAFAREALQQNSDNIGDLSYERVSSARLARILGSLKKFDLALEFAERGKKAAESLKDPKNRQKGIAFAHFQQAGLDREKGDCQSAMAAYDRAIETYDSMEIGQYHYEARKGKLLCRLAASDGDVLDKELPEVLRLFEENRGRIVEEQNRNSFFNDEQSVYDLAISYEFARGNFETAFNYSERSRSRSLLDLIRKDGEVSYTKTQRGIVFDPDSVVIPLTLAELRPRIPLQTQIVEYAVLPDKILIWLVTNERFETYSVNISSEHLSRQVISFAEAIRNDDKEDIGTYSTPLYQALIRPIEPHLDKLKATFIVPDKILFRLPFAALSSDTSGQYLISNFRLAFSPSANVFVLSSESASLKGSTTDEVLLSIGDPNFDRSEFPGLNSLPAAAKEASEITKLYPRHTLLVGDLASKERIENAIDRSDIFHFAAHYSADPLSPMMSAFAVAGSGGESRFANYELLSNKFEKTKLVVLSACETAVETYYEGEGMIGAGRTLLAAGVPVVIASQWKIDSDATAELMEKFHRYRRQQNLPSVAALQRAQLEMLNGPSVSFRQPSSWAGFIALGGYSEF